MVIALFTPKQWLTEHHQTPKPGHLQLLPHTAGHGAHLSITNRQTDAVSSIIDFTGFMEVRHGVAACK